MQDTWPTPSRSCRPPLRRLMFRRCFPKSRTCTGGQIVWPKFPCRISRCSVPMTAAGDENIKTFACVCEMILRKLIKNMTGVFSRSWTIPSITSMTGWSKFWARETQRPLASILIPPRWCGANSLNGKTQGRDARHSLFAGPKTMRQEGFCRARLLPLPDFLSITFFVVLCLCVSNPSVAAPPAQQTNPKQTSAQKHTVAKKRSATPAKPPLASSLAEQQLERLAHELHEHPMGMAYERLVDFAQREKGTAIGARAALALGYYDYSRAHFTEARSWLEKAAADPLLADYAMFWEAQNDRAAGAVDIALVELKRYPERYPDTAMSDSAVEALAQAAIAAGQPADAVAALQAYPKTTAKASLLLLRAQANEKAAVAKGEKPIAAANDYLEVIYRFPINDEAKIAVERIPYLQAMLGEQ